MKKIYEDSKDLHVAATVLFAGEDNYLYLDEGLEHKVSKDDAVDSFNKGLLINTETGMVRPYIINIEDDYASIAYDDGTELVTLYSDGYTASQGNEQGTE